MSYPGGLLASTLGLLGGLSQSILAEVGPASGEKPRVSVTKEPAATPQLSVSVAPVLAVLPQGDGLLGGVARF